MRLTFILVFGLVGAVFASPWIALSGALAGYALAEVVLIKKRLQRLELRLQAQQDASVSAAEHSGQADEMLKPSRSENANSLNAATTVEPASRATFSATGSIDAENLQPEAIGTSADAGFSEQPSLVGNEFAATDERDAEPYTRDNTRNSTRGNSASSASERANPVVQWVFEFFTGGNSIARVGMVVLFFGLAFLAKYAVDQQLVSIEYRLLGMALAAVAMLVVGWRLREGKQSFALTLQGGGIGALFLIIYSAYALYGLLPTLPTFVLLVIIAVSTAALAVLQNSKALAILGIIGGFIAPVLVSSGHGDHVILFAYYSVLNLGILLVSRYQAWRELNVLGFFFTFVIASAWGYQSYQPQYFASTEPFLLFHFVIYTVVALLFCSRPADNPKGLVDAGLVFGTPVIVFFLQSRLVANDRYALAISALGFAAYYIAFAWWLLRKYNKEEGEPHPELKGRRSIAECFLAIGVVFASLAIPFGLSGSSTSALWALEGTAIVWLGVRQSQLTARVFGYVLQALAGLVWAAGLNDAQLAQFPITGVDYLGSLLLVSAGLLTSWWLYKAGGKDATTLRRFEFIVLYKCFLVYVLLCWLGGGLSQFNAMVAESLRLLVTVGFVSASIVMSFLLARFLAWPNLTTWFYLFLPFVACLFAGLLIETAHPFALYGYLAWPLAVVTLYWGLYQFDGQNRKSIALLHSGSLIFTLLILTLELSWHISQLSEWADSWRLFGFGIVPALTLWLLSERGQRLEWPLARHYESYLRGAGALISAYLLLWFVTVNTQAGDPYPLPYIPVINPVDIASSLVLLAWLAFVKRFMPLQTAATQREIRRFGSYFLPLLIFFWLNMMVLRTLHFYYAIPFNSGDMFASQLVQTTLSIFWASLAVATMVLSSRSNLRVAWFAGAALVAVVTVKLFMVDLSNSDTMARIIAFIAVGILLLLVGYLTPVPPRQPVSPGKQAEAL